MKLYTRNELNDGRIFFDKKPPRYMTVFIVLLIFFLVISALGAQFIKRPYVVKAQGTVSADGKSYLSTQTQGVITEIHAESGQIVNVGDVILNMSSGSEGLQKSVVDAQIAELEDTLLIMDKYEEALERGENDLSKSGKELEYYGKVSYYLDVYSQETYEVNKTKKDVAKKQTELDELKTGIKHLEIELNSVNEQVSEDEKVNEKLNSELIEKENKQQTLNAEITKLEENTFQNGVEKEITQKLIEKREELDELTKEVNNNQIENQKNKGLEKLLERQTEVKSDLEMEKSKVEEIGEEIKQLNEQSHSPYSQADQTRLQLISELGEKRNQIHTQLTELRANAGMATEQDAVHVITAAKSGTLHYLQPLSTGMSLQQNQIVGEIATEAEGFYIDAYIQAQDRSRIVVDQSVNVAIIGINNYRFGTATGKLEFIEPGTIQNETAEGIVNLYRARISLNENILTSKSGEVIELVNSMPVEARVVYQEESYLEWLLNLLNLKSK